MRGYRRLVSNWLTGALLATGALLCQQPVFRSDVNLITVSVRVTDKSNHVIHDLKKSDFTLLEEGQPQTIAVFAPERQPVTLGILLDTSASMSGEKIRQAKDALEPLISAGHPDNEIWYMEFGNTLGPIVELSAANRHLPDSVTRATAQRSSTALYDAIAVALCRLRNARNPRQALVVITDGADQHSRIRLPETVRLVQSSPVQVFMIGYFTRGEASVYSRYRPTVELMNGQDIDNPFVAFEKLARESGAEEAFPKNGAGLRAAIAGVASALETQYTLGYYPRDTPTGHGGPVDAATNAPGAGRAAGAATEAWRKIAVQVNRQGLRVITRRGVSRDPADALSLLFHSRACAISAEERPFPHERKTTFRDGLKIYHDDFLDTTSGWPQNSFVEDNPSMGNVRVASSITRRGYVSGGYELSFGGQNNSSKDDAVISAYGSWWTDFRATLTLTPRTSSLASGMVFRLNNDGFYAFLLYVPAHTNSAYYKVLRREYAGKSVDLAEWQLADLGPAQIASIQRKLTVEAHGDSLTFFIDGRKLTSLRDSTMVDGFVGMALYGQGQARFHDLLVEELR